MFTVCSSILPISDALPKAPCAQNLVLATDQPQTSSPAPSQMWQEKHGAEKDAEPGTGATVGEGAANALTPGAVSAVPSLSSPGGNGPAAAQNGEVTGGWSLSMLKQPAAVPC